MTTSFYTAATATIQSQKGMDVLANNVANVSTVGYKGSAASFADLLYTNLEGGDGRVGHGSRLDKTDTLFAQGPVLPTGRMLDFALTGDHTFFYVAGQDGLRYTRDGNFSLSQQEDGSFRLVLSASGDSVLDAGGQPIAVDPGALEELQDTIGIYSFPNADGLVRDGANCFLATETSGDAFVLEGATLQQGSLEGSSVNLATEMVNIIQYQRAFQLNTRMVQILDEIAQTVNNLR